MQQVSTSREGLSIFTQNFFHRQAIKHTICKILMFIRGSLLLTWQDVTKNLISALIKEAFPHMSIIKTEI